MNFPIIRRKPFNLTAFDAPLREMATSLLDSTDDTERTESGI